MALKHLIQEKPELTAWVEYKYGLRFKLRYISRHELQKLGESCQVVKFDPTIKGRARQIDPERFANEYCRRVVVDWDNVTFESLSNIVPLKRDEIPADQWTVPLKFDIEDMQDIIKRAFELDNFIQDTSTDLTVFNPDKEEVEKNSVTSQSGN